jgi:hypothetical protein
MFLIISLFSIIGDSPLIKSVKSIAHINIFLNYIQLKQEARMAHFCQSVNSLFSIEVDTKNSQLMCIL